jgi:hypothetical protein
MVFFATFAKILHMTNEALDSTQQPGNWAAGLPIKELYDAYATTVSSRFKAFGLRTFEEARFDMAQPYHAYDPTREIDKDILDVILTPESHERYKEQMANYVRDKKLASWLEYGGSLVFATDHGQFTDVPVTAETIGEIGLGSRQNTLQVISTMIATLELDLTGDDLRPIIDTLKNVSALGQTVPRLDGDPSDELEAYREQMNETSLSVLSNVKNTPGSITILSVVGRHNKPSRNGRSLFMHEPNRRTIEQYRGENVRVVPLYINCETFGDDGSITPAEMTAEFHDPIVITDPKKDMKHMMNFYKNATERAVGNRYPHGVKIRSWGAQQAKRRVSSAKRRVTNGPEQASAESY